MKPVCFFSKISLSVEHIFNNEQSFYRERVHQTSAITRGSPKIQAFKPIVLTMNDCL